MRRTLISLVGIAILFVSVWVRGTAQGSPRVFEPFVPTPEYSQLVDLMGERGVGFDRMLALAERNKGTTLGATCLFTVAQYTPDEGQRRELISKIIADYPQSRFEIRARTALFNYQDHPTYEIWMKDFDVLLASLGAPTFPEIKANRTRAVRQVRAMPLEYQYGLLWNYNDYAKILINGLSRYRDGVHLCQFGEEAFFYDTDSRFFSDKLNWAVVWLNGGPGAPPDYNLEMIPPTVLVRSPHNGSSTGPYPQIRFDAHTGDFAHLEVFPSAMTFQLDGEDLLKSLDVQTGLTLKRKVGRQFIYKRFRFSYTPTKPLAPGLHTVKVVVPVRGYRPGLPGITTQTWSFRVKSGHRDDREGDNDDHWCDNEEL